jgi:holo-ACP synthase/triphosphoribosyl-dephospho-CoA synthase
LAHGFTGVRGEIEAGLPSVFEAGLPRLREALNQGASDNDALVHALLGLMTHTEDTTILHRHDLATLEKVRTEAAEILSAGGCLTSEGREKTAALDRHYISARISPGGSADLLAVTWFLHRMEEMFSADG